MNNYNFELLERENKQLYESVDFNIAKILKKYNTSMYKYFTMFLASNKTNNYCGEKVYNYLYNLYLNSLTKDDLKELKFLNKQINRLKKKIEFEFLATFTETSIIDVPPMQNNELVINLSDKIILRDSEGFYRTNEGYYVVAASDMAQGTTFEGSKGTCIVLDSGCSEGVTDYYVQW